MTVANVVDATGNLGLGATPVAANVTLVEERPMILVRRLLGDVLRQERLRQGRTLRDVSASAQVSLGYISEIERGQKEASSECLAAICGALEVPLSVVLADVSFEIAREEAAGTRVASLATFAAAPAGVQDLAA